MKKLTTARIRARLNPPYKGFNSKVQLVILCSFLLSQSPYKGFNSLLQVKF